jgi:urease alpha subunit
MAEVLAGIGSLFGGGAGAAKGIQGIGPVASGSQYAQMLQQPAAPGPVGIGPVASGSQYAQMLQQQPNPMQNVQGFFADYAKQSKALNENKQQAAPLQMMPMQTNAPNTATRFNGIIGFIRWRK